MSLYLLPPTTIVILFVNHEAPAPFSVHLLVCIKPGSIQAPQCSSSPMPALFRPQVLLALALIQASQPAARHPGHYGQLPTNNWLQGFKVPKRGADPGYYGILDTGIVGNDIVGDNWQLGFKIPDTAADMRSVKRKYYNGKRVELDKPTGAQFGNRDTLKDARIRIRKRTVTENDFRDSIARYMEDLTEHERNAIYARMKLLNAINNYVQ